MSLTSRAPITSVFRMLSDWHARTEARARWEARTKFPIPHLNARAFRPVENLREPFHFENYSSLRSTIPLRFSTGLTTPQHLMETAES